MSFVCKQYGGQSKAIKHQPQPQLNKEGEARYKMATSNGGIDTRMMTI